MSKQPEILRVYQIWVNVVNQDKDGKKEVLRLPYLGKDTVTVTTKFLNNVLFAPIDPENCTVMFGRPQFDKPLSIEGIKDLQYHLDFILESINNKSIVMDALHIETTNELRA